LLAFADSRRIADQEAVRRAALRWPDTVENALDVDVDHLLPIFHAQFVEQGSWRNAGIIDRNV
jgi:hypothetical protein